jgi:hypothetical protein
MAAGKRINGICTPGELVNWPHWVVTWPARQIPPGRVVGGKTVGPEKRKRQRAADGGPLRRWRYALQNATVILLVKEVK